MGDKTKIEWTEATWNPVTGCTKVSPGCDHCYIDRTPPFRMAGRKFDGPTVGATTGVILHPERLDQPLRWTRPRRIFVNSLSDLFHDDIPDEYIAKVFAAMALAPQHTFQLLTKRHGRMRSLLSQPSTDGDAFIWKVKSAMWDWALTLPGTSGRRASDGWNALDRSGWWPLPNLWLGVTVEDQTRADLRIPALLATPAAVRFLSCEPLLGSVSLDRFSPARVGGAQFHDALRPLVDTVDGHELMPRIDWVIAGGESGPEARPMHPAWARSLRDQCAAAGVPFHFKQWGEWGPVGPTHPKAVGFKPRGTFSSRIEVLTEPVTGWKGTATTYGDATPMARVGKRAAGRLLDGRTHDDYPTATNPGGTP